MAERFQVALDTFRFAGVADAAAVPDQLVRKLYPSVLRNDLDEVLLDLFWILMGSEFEAIGEALDMRIHDHSAGNSISRAQYYVCCFSGDSGKRKNLFHGFWNIAAKMIKDGFARAHDRFRLIAEKTCWTDVFLQLARVRIGKCLGVGVFLEQGFCN